MWLSTQDMDSREVAFAQENQKRQVDRVGRGGCSSNLRRRRRARTRRSGPGLQSSYARRTSARRLDAYSCVPCPSCHALPPTFLPCALPHAFALAGTASAGARLTGLCGLLPRKYKSDRRIHNRLCTDPEYICQ